MSHFLNFTQSNKKNRLLNQKIDKNYSNNYRNNHFDQQIECLREIKIHRKMQTNIENDQIDQKKISKQQQNRKFVKIVQKNEKSFESRNF